MVSGRKATSVSRVLEIDCQESDNKVAYSRSIFLCVQLKMNDKGSGCLRVLSPYY